LFSDDDTGVSVVDCNMLYPIDAFLHGLPGRPISLLYTELAIGLLLHSQWRIQTFGWGKCNVMFPSISRLFLRWWGAKVYNQAGWGPCMAGFALWIRLCAFYISLRKSFPILLPSVRTS